MPAIVTSHTVAAGILPAATTTTRVTSMPFVQITDRMKIEPDYFHVIPLKQMIQKQLHA